MKLIPVNNPRPGQTIQRSKCFKMSPADTTMADMDGEPFKAFYCDRCAKQAATTTKTGYLTFEGPKPLGIETYNWWKCVDCQTLYPEIHGRPSCNHVGLTKCPWCCPDSKPWTNGRGL